VALHHAATPPVIDGKLDEAMWQEAAVMGPFTGPFNPEGPDIATQSVYRTEARAAWDEEHLYVAFICHGPLSTVLHHKYDDPLHEQDVVEMFLDVTGKQKEIAELQVSPSGVTADIYHVWDTPLTYPADKIDWSQLKNLNFDRSWNLAGYTAAGASLTENGVTVGWIVEMAIPMRPILAKQGLPRSLHEGQELRFNLVRYVYEEGAAGKKELRQLNWSPTTRGCPHVSPMALRAVVLTR